MSRRLSKRQHAVKSPGPAGRTPAGDALSVLAIQIFQLNGDLIAAGDALAKPTGQSTARWQVLASIEEAPASVAQIAHTLRLARQSVQRVADLLVADGIATYEPNPDHRRAKLLRLTPRGRSTLTKIQTAQRTWADTLGGEIGEPELRQASSVLTRLLTSRLLSIDRP